jgi:hypothetical protein
MRGGKPMLRTFCSPLVVALAALCVVSATALAAGATVFGTIQNVDTDQGRLTLRAGEEKIVELQAPAELLAGLQTGDAVEVKVSGQKATMIRKQGEAQQPEAGGALLQQQPDGMRPSP